jgi:hypothetical protein
MRETGARSHIRHGDCSSRTRSTKKEPGKRSIRHVAEHDHVARSTSGSPMRARPSLWTLRPTSCAPMAKSPSGGLPRIDLDTQSVTRHVTFNFPPLTASQEVRRGTAPPSQDRPGARAVSTAAAAVVPLIEARRSLGASTLCTSDRAEMHLVGTVEDSHRSAPSIHRCQGDVVAHPRAAMNLFSARAWYSCDPAEGSQS